MWNKWLFNILIQCMASASPAIVEGIRELVQGMVNKAKETANPWDDMFCGLLQTIIGKPNEPITTEPDDPTSAKLN